MKYVFLVGLVLAGLFTGELTAAEPTRAAAQAAMRKAASFYRENLALQGGYVYYYSLDLKKRWGEGEAAPDQIWVQPPGTPAVGLAFLNAYRATGDDYYLNGAQEAAVALAWGQLSTGGWTNSIRIYDRSQGLRRRDGVTSLDDGQTQSALRLVMAVDEAMKFQHAEIHAAAQFGLDSLLAAQFPNGGFPQGWRRPAAEHPIMRASYPDYDWKTEGRIKNYWDMYTLNDNVCGYVADTLLDAHRIYGGEKYLTALKQLGDFLLLAQMPEPQPAWAQQYNYEMKPIWARAFEPPAIASDETQETLETLLQIAAATRDAKYLAPFPKALAYLRKSQLPGQKLARFYELETNRPLYMTRPSKKVYRLTYDDSQLPGHYGWKIASRIDDLERRYEQLLQQDPATNDARINPAEVQAAIDELDPQGRWIDKFDGTPIVGQLKLPIGTPYISSQTFCDRLTLLSDYVARQK